MLTSLRSKAIQLIPRYARTLSSDPNIPQEYELFAKLAGPDALTDVPKPSLAPTPTTEADSSEVPFDPTLMIIPPAQDPLLQYIAAKITHRGMRAKATRRVSRVLMHIHGYTRAQPLPILRNAVLATSPAVRVAMHKKSAKVIAMPMALSEKQRTRFGVEWILQASEKRTGKSLDVRLAQEIVAVIQGSSEALKKKEEVHRFAMLNRYGFCGLPGGLLTMACLIQG